MEYFHFIWTPLLPPPTADAEACQPVSKEIIAYEFRLGHRRLLSDQVRRSMLCPALPGAARRYTLQPWQRGQPRAYTTHLNAI